MYQSKPDAVVALNRAIARGEVAGAEAALADLQKMEEGGELSNYYLLPATLGEFYARIGNREAARKYLEAALNLTKAKAEQNLLMIKISAL